MNSKEKDEIGRNPIFKTWINFLQRRKLILPKIVLRFSAVVFSWICVALIAGALLLDVSIWLFARDLPNHDQLANHEPPIISRIFSIEGRLIDEFAKERRLFSPIDEIPLLVRDAFISAEDKNFFLHQGYDPIGMIKALVQALDGSRLRGASTITQQVMKNFLLSSDRSVERKIQEIILAYRLEQSLSKDKILELYLNEIFLGQNSYGVTAAAQTYFNKPLSEVSIEEAAYLAALPKAPSNYHPIREKNAAVARRNFVIAEMIDNGTISKEAGEQAKASPFRTVMSGDFESFRSKLPQRSYFTDEIRRQLSGTFGEEEFFTGGLTIRATIDQDLQMAAGTALREGLERYDRTRAGVWRGTGLSIDESRLSDESKWRADLASLVLPRDIKGWQRAVVLNFSEGGATIGVEGLPAGQTAFVPDSDVAWVTLANGGTADAVEDILKAGDVVFAAHLEVGTDAWTLKQIPAVQGAFMAMDANSGRVLAMQGGFSYAQSVFNRATQAERQPGSAFKPFVYAAALDSGYTPATIIIDAPIEVETPEGVWSPKNSSERFYGPVTLRTGIEMSRNLMTVRLARDIGMENVVDYALDLGIYEHMDPFLANALGAQETTLFNMVAAYAMFANGGERLVPTLVDRVQDRWGKTVYQHDDRLCLDCKVPELVQGTVPQLLSHRPQVIDSITAFQLTSMMEGVVQQGTARLTVNPGVPVAGKTGTTNESRDAWFIGYTPDIVAGCYIGFDTPRTLGRRAYGSNLCGPVFNEFIKAAVEKYGFSEFPAPQGGIFMPIDRVTGELISAETAAAEPQRAVIEYFRLGTEPRQGTIQVVDGGFAMASDLGLFDPKAEEQETAQADNQIVPDNIDRGSLGSISSGGLY